MDVVTWEKYLEVEDGKIDLKKAFTRGLRDELTKDSGRILKLWRDEIVRDLAASGRIDQVREYTQYIDEVVQKGRPVRQPDKVETT